MEKLSLLIFTCFTFTISSCTRNHVSINSNALNEIRHVNQTTSLGREKGEDTYQYQFDIQNKFSNANSDEFESKESNAGFRSGEIAEFENGETQTIKSENDLPTDCINQVEFVDKNENNDWFQTATSLYSVGTNKGGIYKHWVWCYATISQKTEGILWWKKTYIDKDFYSFDAVSTGTLKVSLTDIPSSCDYDLRLYRITDCLECNYSECVFDSPIASSSNPTGKDEEITISITPGTYYACVYSYQDKTYDNENAYKITFEECVDTSRNGSYYSIESGRNVGDFGAVWRSDYKPLGITPISLSGENAMIGLSNSSTYPYIKHLIDQYSSGESVTYAIVYVWDVELRALIYSSLKLILEKVYEQPETYFNSFNIIWNAVGLALSIAGLVVSTIAFAEIVTSAVVSGAINATSVSMGILSTILSYAIGYEFDTSKQDLINYLISAIASFEVSKGSNNQEVVMLRFKYKFVKKERWYLDWTPTYNVNESNRYNDDMITYQLNGSPVDGRVFGFQDESMLNNLLGY